MSTWLGKLRIGVAHLRRAGSRPWARWALLAGVPTLAWLLVSAREGRPLGMAAAEAELVQWRAQVVEASSKAGIPPELLAGTLLPAAFDRPRVAECRPRQLM